MFSAAMRPVNRFFSAAFTQALPVYSSPRRALYIDLARRKRSGVEGEQIADRGMASDAAAILPARTGRVGLASSLKFARQRASAQCPPYK